MNFKISTLLAATLALGAFAISPSVRAANTVLYWDSNGATGGTGGSGTWDTATSDWRLTNSSGALQTYTNTAPSTITAELPTTTGTVTLASSTTINVNEIQFDVTGYNLNGASGSKIVLSVGAGASNAIPLIVAAAGTDTVNAVLDGTAGLDKGGSGALVLNGANTYTGNTTINGGILSINTIGTTGVTSSSLGAGTGTILMGSGSNSATLIYTGSGETTDRIVSLAGANGTTANVIENDGGGSLNFTHDMTSSLSGSRTLQFQGSNGGTFSGKIVNGTGTTPVLSIVKAGAGTWTFSGANTYSGGTTISAGTLVAGISNSGSTSGAFGPSADGVTLGDANSTGTSNPTLLIGGAFTVSNPITVGAFTDGTATIGGTNASATTATYTGSVTLAKAATLMAAAGATTDFNAGAWTTGNFAITVGSSGNTGTVELDNAVNTSGGLAVSFGTLELNSNSSSSAVTVASGAKLSGTGTAAGTTVTGTISPGSVASPYGTLTVGPVSFVGGSTFAVALNGTSGANKLVSTGTATFAGTDNITFSGSTGATTIAGVGDYQLATATGGLTTGAFTGTAPTDYRLLGSGTSLDLVHEATISINTPTTSAASIITGGSTAISFTVSNTAPSGSSNLNATAAAGTNVTGSLGTTFTTAPGGTPQASGTGLAFTGTTTGAGQTGSFTVSDSNADNSPQTGTVSVNVYGHATSSLSTGTLTLGNIHAGSGGTTTSSVASSNSLGVTNGTGYQVNLKGSAPSSGNVSVNSVSGIASSGSGLSGSSSGSISATLASGQAVGAISTPLTYTFADDSTLSGNGNIGTAALTVTGQVYSGLMNWTASSGGNYANNANWTDSVSGGSGVHVAPGLDGGYQSTDTATFSSTGGSVDLVNVSPSLNSVTFNSSSAYTLTSSGTGTLQLNGGGSNALVAVTTGTDTISAPISLTTSANVAVNTGQQLTISGAISGSGTGLAFTGAGKTLLMTDNGYTGPTTISAGTVYANNTGGATYTAPSSPTRTVTPTNSTGSATGTGAVTVNSGGTLAGSGTIAGASLAVNAGGTLASGGIQSGTTAGQGLTINSTAISITGATTGSHTTANTANLTFDLGAGGSSSATQANPNTNSTYLSLTGSTSINFVGHTSITLVDLTNGGLAALRLNSPYLLISAGSNSDYTGLVTVNTSGVESLNGNGYVLGVFVSGSAGSYVYDPINFNEVGADGVTPLTSIGSGPTGVSYVDPQLVLYNGDLEIVPEPGTWALMIGGLASLVLIQARRRRD